ncbi:MAG: imidazolonepropionase [Anaerolineae bacterium SM23_ 63]|nr:MAG: imidazolonepropionase [Anaerolineae bacterium SM23_ 63]HEY46952.1 imidazolonepropionase [Anaerolineae bacterium]
MNIDLLIHNASQILTLAGGPQPGHDLGNLEVVENGALAINDEKIIAVGPSPELSKKYKATQEIDAAGRVVMPGFVDPHTHLIWAGDRAAEFEMRLAGASYMEILNAGGGILSTVRLTRSASVDDLVAQARGRLNRMLSHGTTTAEVKTGYGLETETELRMMEAILRLDTENPVELIPTFLGAHAIPSEFSDDPVGYTDLICDEMLPSLVQWWEENATERSLPFVDVFCETGAFNLDQSRRILERAKELGFQLKIHADEFDGLGGTGLAVELGATSADHLVRTPKEDIKTLGASKTVAVSLPCTPFGLAESDYTPAKAILEAGGILALATDLNPGTAWCESMQFPIALACRYMHLTPSQAIAAATINAAAAVARADTVGSLEPEKQADVLIIDTPDYRHLGYRFGVNLISTVIKRGKIVFSRGGEEII